MINLPYDIKQHIYTFDNSKFIWFDKGFCLKKNHPHLLNPQS